MISRLLASLRPAGPVERKVGVRVVRVRVA